MSEQATSNNGAPYEIGRPETGGEGGGAAAGVSDGVKAQAKKPFDIAVDWPRTSDFWVETTKEVQEVAGITRYKLLKTSHPIYTYLLEFTNTTLTLDLSWASHPFFQLSQSALLRRAIHAIFTTKQLLQILTPMILVALQQSR